jgi:hypothetical protein
MRILKGLSSRRLPCGCIVGIYETYGAEVVALLDSRDHACDRKEHVPGQQLTFEQVVSAASVLDGSVRRG